MNRRFVSSICLSIVITLVLSGSCFSEAVAEKETEEKDKRENSLREGSWSIQFQIEDDIGLKPFTGMIISLKRHISRHSAFRAGLDLDIEFDDGSRETNTEYGDTAIYTHDYTTHSNDQRIELDFLYLNYPNPGANINLLFGTGPLVRFSRRRGENESTHRDSDSTTKTAQTDYYRTWSVGVLALAGVEWFVTESFSFHAEYRASIAYGKSRGELIQTVSGDTQKRKVDTTSSEGWDFDGVSVILGLSVYF